MAAGTEGLPSSAWNGALAVALIGAERAPPAPSSGPVADLDAGGDAGARLLSRIAAAGLHHLAGAGRAAEALTPLPPRIGTGPECPPAAATRLTLLLAGGTGVRDRLREWCDLAAAAGVRAPIWLLPALASYRREFPSLEAIAGPELDWLARACGDAQEPPASAPDWTEGSANERSIAFAAFRERDPAGARAALEAGFKGEKATMRETLVGALRVGLSDADAPFLETCLDDRAAGVRAAAQRLLPFLPNSPFASRMAARAKAALAVEAKRRLLRATTYALAVTLPEESPALARDGVEPKSYERRGGGTRAGLLRDILAAAPLHAFADHPPRLWIELALRSDFPDQIFEGFFQAVAREGDLAWTGAMAAVLGEAYAGRVDGVRRTKPLLELWARAVTLLPQAEWEANLRSVIGGGEIDAILSLLGRGPPLFSKDFSMAVLDWLARLSRGSRSDRHDLAKSWLLHGLGARLSPGDDIAASAAAILARLPDDPDDKRLPEQFARLAEKLELRTAMRREFA
ncbi:DUF5691 domain-containing protein [Methylobacterium iners]|uniref:Uncharacterized protein n=1 Tax=Methylobacterium iners TaxID=418707 RepID=A0ABQ4RSZ0_9HYPH|nr:DUF5691 domain-containing protein [Methylobacterium iners]GJD93092.1 hypothetical protein OCOJLMKI_0279 [Methylobacterium iners]